MSFTMDTSVPPFALPVRSKPALQQDTMENRTLLATVNEIKKAVDDGQDTAIVVAMMDNLKIKASPSEKQLRTTKVGQTIGKIRNHTDGQVSSMAGDIVRKWKESIAATKKATEAKKLSQLKQLWASTRPEYSGSSSLPYTGDTSKRHFTTDNVNLENHETGDTTRDGAILLLYNGLAYGSTEPTDKVVQRAIECEQAAFEVFGGVTDKYRVKCRGFLSALKRKDNKKIGEQIMSREITAREFVTMELLPAKQRARDEVLQKDNMKKAQVPMGEKSVSSTVKCPECEEIKVSYTHAQTHLVNERIMTFCECANCGLRWKL